MSQEGTDRWTQVGLTREEYDLILEILDREPNDLELGMFGLMWSEHCSYKSSRIHLEALPTEAPHVLQGPGENAGAIDIGDGLAAVFRMESHNHPSAIEPFQGAATGVGGILRDIFTMGARPVALLDSLRFGDPDKDRQRFLASGVVSGIAHYGNSVGVPTVGGEVFFDPDFADNPLVNVMCLGVCRHEDLIRGRAEGVGNPVFLVGAKTGRDGIHGASILASQEFDENPEDMRPAVQVGDPFMEKLLIEACLQLIEEDLVVGLNDLGAAGLTSACSETASRAGSGMTVDIRLVPRREEGMNAYEVMLSESQERMLVIARKGCEDQVAEVLDRWGLDSVVLGRVSDDGYLTVVDGEEVLARIPAHSLSSRAPAYNRPTRQPQEPTAPLDLARIKPPEDLGSALAEMLGSPNLGSRRWIYRQYDHMVGTDTVVLPGGDAAVIRIKGTSRAVSVSTDANSRHCYLDPRRGASLAVAEAARNAVCVGARPAAITNCLNFGNPERPGTMWAFRQAIEGMAEACRALGTPVTGGNVSFYNETRGKPVKPSPVVGMVGILEDVHRRLTAGFKNAGDLVALLGLPRGHLGGSEYLSVIHGLSEGLPPDINWDEERSVQEACLRAASEGILNSAHDVSDGGLAVALAEGCFLGSAGARGADVCLRSDLRPDALLFGEEPSRIVVTLSPDRLEDLQAVAEQTGAPFLVMGRVLADPQLIIRTDEESPTVDADVERLYYRWREALEWLS